MRIHLRRRATLRRLHLASAWLFTPRTLCPDPSRTARSGPQSPLGPALAFPDPHRIQRRKNPCSFDTLPGIGDAFAMRGTRRGLWISGVGLLLAPSLAHA